MRALLVVHDEPLHLADGERLVEVGADADLLAEMVARAAEDRAERVVAAHDLDRFVEPALAHEAHVLRDLLVHRALVGTRRLDAVEQPKRTDGFRARGVERLLAVAPVLEDLAGVGREARRRVLGEGREVLRAGLLHRRRGVLEVLGQAQVAAGLQEVGADGDGLHPAGEQARHVEGICAGGERHHQAAPELRRELRGQVDRDRMEGAAGQVHHLLFLREDVAPVLDLERVGELDAELHLALLRDGLQAPQHRHRVGVLEVVLEREVGHDRVRVAQPLVQDFAEPPGPEQGRVEFHVRVEAPLLDEVGRDLLDLAGRASVHRGERDVVGQARGHLEAGDIPGDETDVLRPQVAGVAYEAQVLLHVGLEQSLEVVADADVEDHAGGVAGEAELAVERVDEDPGAEVLVERLAHLQLLGPFAVVALVLQVDAGLGDVELVQGLDGLELDEPRAAEPGGDDILGHLRVGAGGDAEGGLEAAAVDLGGERVAGAGREEEFAGDAENGAGRFELAEHPRGERFHRDGLKLVRHGASRNCVRHYSDEAGRAQAFSSPL